MTINRSKVDASTAKVVQRICRAEPIVIDDVGMLPAGQAEAEALYWIADAAHERRSLAVTSNIHPVRVRHTHAQGTRRSFRGSAAHHGHVVVTQGDSQRLAEAISGSGVVPLA